MSSSRFQDHAGGTPPDLHGTGTPEVGGLSSYQMLQLVRGLQGLNLVGFDLVEVSPPYDHSEITAILAANLVFEFLSLLAIKKRDVSMDPSR
ncbi:MAG: hypothetical protein A2X25_08695 [Chloroflexi bacterium GWB2_49_20]|nr:MAG: hypothetical protein A2X25_08695 [Chloroflexi bacterium GWB2_49_20]OGN79488.1 MAG: hypothetical protein A2X26_05330 [Chloroflexi bacterium GWC2_49_37]OGN84589.1 MAG: hypothetical protein A2X27_11200 [Chloroflexi bacterium GWD2_49_16]HCC79302.1 hypothetical protein [Anaerolineae bacterium]HCM97212.1 hypothetical protein [Anaerolineae bacterium]